MIESFLFARAGCRWMFKADRTRVDLPASDQLSQLRVAAASQELDRVGSHDLDGVNFVAFGRRDELSAN
jgi:hypothetical protein